MEDHFSRCATEIATIGNAHKFISCNMDGECYLLFAHVSKAHSRRPTVFQIQLKQDNQWHLVAPSGRSVCSRATEEAARARLAELEVSRNALNSRLRAKQDAASSHEQTPSEDSTKQ
jgi:hypothetical protein